MNKNKYHPYSFGEFITDPEMIPNLVLILAFGSAIFVYIIRYPITIFHNMRNNQQFRDKFNKTFIGYHYSRFRSVVNKLLEWYTYLYYASRRFQHRRGWVIHILKILVSLLFFLLIVILLLKLEFALKLNDAHKQPYRECRITFDDAIHFRSKRDVENFCDRQRIKETTKAGATRFYNPYSIIKK